MTTRRFPRSLAEAFPRDHAGSITIAMQVSINVKPRSFLCSSVDMRLPVADAQLVTFTLTVIEEPHCEVNVTLYGPRNVFLETMEKL